MHETPLVECFLCSREGKTLEMHPAGAPTLGHRLDFALAVKWFCDPCFDTYRNSPHIRKRVHDWQDSAGRWARACVQNISDNDLKAMESLPEGLRVSAPDARRSRWLQDKLEDIEQLQDNEDNAVLHRICRNVNQNRFYNSQSRTFQDYGLLRENFAKLEKLSAAERKKLE